MDLTEIRRLPLDCKTLAQWHQQIRAQAHYFTNKYERCIFSKARGSISMLQFYRKAKDTYFDLHELLSHIEKYGKIADVKNCLSCKHDNKHIERLKNCYNKYNSLIVKCKDGYRYKEAIVLCDDI